MSKITEYHLSKLIPQIIKSYGHAIVHGDGNVFIDKPSAEEKHQPSYLHRVYCADANKEGKQWIRFTSVNEIPGTIEAFDNLLAMTMARNEANSKKIQENDGVITLPKEEEEVPKDKEPEVKEEIPIPKAESKKMGRPSKH